MWKVAICLRCCEGYEGPVPHLGFFAYQKLCKSLFETGKLSEGFEITLIDLVAFRPIGLEVTDGVWRQFVER